jgi:NAD(P)-dependent dehydrogenase (short-subunit alcohol dehydrogenase family)
VYSASKHALEALSDALRAELRGSGVTLSLIEPGGVDTPMAQAQSALAAGNLDRLDASLRAHYAPLYRGYAAMTTQVLRHASRPENVAAVAVSAVLATAPKPRYLVGVDARLLVTLKQCLPTRWLDAMLMWLNLRN